MSFMDLNGPFKMLQSHSPDGVTPFWTSGTRAFKNVRGEGPLLLPVVLEAVEEELVGGQKRTPRNATQRNFPVALY